MKLSKLISVLALSAGLAMAACGDTKTDAADGGATGGAAGGSAGGSAGGAGGSK